MNEFTAVKKKEGYVVILNKTQQEFTFSMSQIKNTDISLFNETAIPLFSRIPKSIVLRSKAFVYLREWIKENKPEELI